MTLKTRNRLFNLLFLASLISVAIALGMFILALLQGTILTPPDLRIPPFIARLPFAKTQFVALMMSFGVIIFYVPICFFMILRYFENTQTSEIIFFTGFLIGCTTELFRFLTICFGLWQTFSNMLIFSGNIVLFGRTLVPLSFICASLLSNTDQRQDVERNYIIMITTSVVFAAIIPMNTAKISSTGLVTEGFMFFISIMRVLLILVAFVSFFIHGIKKNSVEYKSIAVSFIILIFGYSVVISSDTFVFLIPGTALLIYGTYRYLKNIHQLYMWA